MSVLYVEREGRQRELAAFLTPLTGAVRGLVSAVYALLKPFQHFAFDPPHPAFAKSYPLGELPGCLKAGDVLRRIEDQLPELTLRQNPHRGISSFEEHRDAPWVDAHWTVDGIPTGIVLQ